LEVNCSYVGNVWLNDTSDNVAAAQCGSLQANVNIAPSETGAISLDGLSSLGTTSNGSSFDAVNVSQVSSISSDSLEVVGAWFVISNMTALVKLSFPKLSWIGQTFRIVDAPMLQQLTLSTSVTIGHTYPNVLSAAIINTSLSKVEGFFSDTIQDVQIVNNPKISFVNLTATQILLQENTSYTGTLSIWSNGPEVQMIMPNLFSVAGDVLLGDCSRLSAPQLQLVNGSMNMPNASLPSLSLPVLERINGDLNVTGSFSRLGLEHDIGTSANSTDSPEFPTLNYIGGNLFLESSNYIDCAPFRQLYVNGGIKGSLTCTGATTPTTGPAATMTTVALTPNSAGSTGGLSAGAKGGIIAGAIVAGLLLVGFLAFMILRRYRRGTTNAAGGSRAMQDHYPGRSDFRLTVFSNEPRSPRLTELPAGYQVRRSEMAAMPNQVSELRGDLPSHPVHPLR
jgi:hypothetical protein